MTDANGKYITIVEFGFSGTLTPSKSGCTFSPPNRAYTNLTTSPAAQNFTVNQSFTLSGRVADTNGTGVSGVAISGLPGTPVTDAGGNYAATVSYGFSGTATPNKPGYAIAPASRAYSNVIADQTAQDYAGTAACLTTLASWQNRAFLTAQTGTFTAEFDAIPNNANMDGVTGLSTGQAGTFTDQAVTVRFNTSGMIDARDGATAYRADTQIPYFAGTVYHFRLVVNVVTHRFTPT